MGRDLSHCLCGQSHACFNPRAPCGARRLAFAIPEGYHMFQSTRPVWGATRRFAERSIALVVSIHAPRVGRDAGACYHTNRGACFNPRAPCGARQERGGHRAALIEFQSTRPVWGATTTYPSEVRVHFVSIHAPRVGRDIVRAYGVGSHICFNPRAPCGARL